MVGGMCWFTDPTLHKSHFWGWLCIPSQLWHCLAFTWFRICRFDPNIIISSFTWLCFSGLNGDLIRLKALSRVLCLHCRITYLFLPSAFILWPILFIWSYQKCIFSSMSILTATEDHTVAHCLSPSQHYLELGVWKDSLHASVWVLLVPDMSPVRLEGKLTLTNGDFTGWVVFKGPPV